MHSCRGAEACLFQDGEVRRRIVTLRFQNIAQEDENFGGEKKKRAEQGKRGV